MAGPLNRVDELVGLVSEHADLTQETRRPSSEVMRAFADRGLMRLLVPAAYGGAQLHPLDFLAVIEAVARVDGSAAWTVMTCNEEAEIACAHLPVDHMTELYRSFPDAIVAGSGVPRGSARRVDGGWLVSGQWDFISGGPVADRIVLAVARRDGEHRGEVVHVLLDADEVAFVDTWHTIGMRGTGSGDVRCDDVVVDDARSASSVAGDRLVPENAFYRLPSGLRFPFPKVGVASGIARAAIDAFVDLANEKRPLTQRAPLRERADAHAAVARAEALRASGRAHVVEVLDELWTVAERDGEVSDELHARVRLACSFSVQNSIEAVELVHRAAGSTGHRTASPLARHLLDVRVVAGHFMVAPYQMDHAGRVLLGLPSGDGWF